MANIFSEVASRLPGAQPREPSPKEIEVMENAQREDEVVDTIERNQDIQQEMALTGNSPSPYDDDQPAPRDELEHRKQVITPTRHDNDYPYYKYRVQENRLGNIDDGERLIQDKYVALINSFEARGIKEMAEEYFTEKLLRLDHSASVDMSQQRVWQQRQVGLTRTVVHTNEEKKRGL